MARNAVQPTTTLISAQTSATGTIDAISTRMLAIQITTTAGATGTCAIAISLDGTGYQTVDTLTLSENATRIVHLVDMPVTSVKATLSVSGGTASVYYAKGSW